MAKPDGVALLRRLRILPANLGRDVGHHNLHPSIIDAMLLITAYCAVRWGWTLPELHDRLNVSTLEVGATRATWYSTG
jgi:hypothetical protein